MADTEITDKQINPTEQCSLTNLPPAPSHATVPKVCVSLRCTNSSSHYPLFKMRYTDVVFSQKGFTVRQTMKKEPEEVRSAQYLPVFSYFLSTHCLEKSYPVLGSNWELISSQETERPRKQENEGTSWLQQPHTSYSWNSTCSPCHCQLCTLRRCQLSMSGFRGTFLSTAAEKSHFQNKVAEGTRALRFLHSETEMICKGYLTSDRLSIHMHEIIPGWFFPQRILKTLLRERKKEKAVYILNLPTAKTRRKTACLQTLPSTCSSAGEGASSWRRQHSPAGGSLRRRCEPPPPRARLATHPREKQRLPRVAEAQQQHRLPAAPPALHEPPDHCGREEGAPEPAAPAAGPSASAAPGAGAPRQAPTARPGSRQGLPAGPNSRIVTATASSARRTESTAGSGARSSRRSASRCGSSLPAMSARAHTSPRAPLPARGPPGRAGVSRKVCREAGRGV